MVGFLFYLWCSHFRLGYMIDCVLVYACVGVFVLGYGDLSIAFRITDWFSSLPSVICVGVCGFCVVLGCCLLL